MLSQRVGEVLRGGRAEGLGVGGLDGLDGGGLGVRVARGEDGVEGAGVVVQGSGVVERVDGVARLLARRGVQVRGAVGGAGLPLDDVQRAVRHVAWVALAEGALALRSFAFGNGGGGGGGFVDGLVEDVRGGGAGVAEGDAAAGGVVVHVVGGSVLGGGSVEGLAPVVTGLAGRGHGLAVEGGVGDGDAVGTGEDGALVPASLGWLGGVENGEELFARVLG